MAEASRGEIAAESAAAALPVPAPEVLGRAAPLADRSMLDHQRLHAGFDPQAHCVCDDISLRNGWCWRCNVGRIAGREITCAALYETLDPHGHELDNGCLQLRPCHEAIASDGYCEGVGIGFVGGKAYFTRLTYGIARGEPIDPATLRCDTCRSHMSQTGWCEECRCGIVGSIALTDRDLFERTAHEYAIFQRAIVKAEECDLCACAMVAHRACPKCRISYESPTPVPLVHRGASPSPRQTLKNVVTAGQ